MREKFCESYAPLNIFATSGEGFLADKRSDQRFTNEVEKKPRDIWRTQGFKAAAWKNVNRLEGMVLARRVKGIIKI